MEIINSFFNNIKDKLTNPFFGTLILVLIIHHWELWYTIFNFDSDCTLEDKTTFIRNYTAANLSFYKFMWDVVQAVFFMLLGYMIIVATRSLVMWVEFSLMPFLTGKIVSKNVVRKSEYDEVVKEREQYFDQYEEQRKNVRVFSKTIDEQTQQIKQKDEDLLRQSDTISSTIRELDITKNSLERVMVDNKSQATKIKTIDTSLAESQKENEFKISELKGFGGLFFNSENESFYSSYDKFPPEIINKVKELKNENLWQIFLSVGSFLTLGGTIGGEAVTKMVNKGMAFEKGGHEELTPIGKIIWRYRSIFNEDE